MESETYSGEKTLELYDEKKFAKNLADPNIKKITIHKAGSIIQMSDRKYRVESNGSWVRIYE